MIQHIGWNTFRFGPFDSLTSRSDWLNRVRRELSAWFVFCCAKIYLYDQFIFQISQEIPTRAAKSRTLCTPSKHAQERAQSCALRQQQTPCLNLLHPHASFSSPSLPQSLDTVAVMYFAFSSKRFRSIFSIALGTATTRLHQKRCNSSCF
jgi:hypothetical protein